MRRVDGASRQLLFFLLPGFFIAEFGPRRAL